MIPEEGRYDTCRILVANGIPNAVWFEDLLALHGSDTIVWDLSHLIDDPNAAAVLLCKLNYKCVLPDDRYEHIHEIAQSGIRMVLPTNGLKIVLLRAHDWHYDMSTCPKSCVPRICDFLDAIMDLWLNMSSVEYDDRLLFALHLACLIDYAYSLKYHHGKASKANSFAENLREEHRELHFDMVSNSKGRESWTFARRHERHARTYRNIKEGNFTPEPCTPTAFKQSLAALPEQ